MNNPLLGSLANNFNLSYDSRVGGCKSLAFSLVLKYHPLCELPDVISQSFVACVCRPFPALPSRMSLDVLAPVANGSANSTFTGDPSQMTINPNLLSLLASGTNVSGVSAASSQANRPNPLLHPSPLMAPNAMPAAMNMNNLFSNIPMYMSPLGMPFGSQAPTMHSAKRDSDHDLSGAPNAKRSQNSSSTQVPPCYHLSWLDVCMLESVSWVC
jgi:hypothetical protein